MSTSSPDSTVPFRELRLGDIPRVGGKNASLGELIGSLAPLGIRVPDGFAVTAQAFQTHIAASQLAEQIYPALERLDVQDVQALAREGQRVRDLIRGAPLPERLSAEIPFCRTLKEADLVLAELAKSGLARGSEDALPKVVKALAVGLDGTRAAANARRVSLPS